MSASLGFIKASACRANPEIGQRNLLMPHVAQLKFNPIPLGTRAWRAQLRSSLLFPAVTGALPGGPCQPNSIAFLSPGDQTCDGWKQLGTFAFQL